MVLLFLRIFPYIYFHGDPLLRLRGGGMDNHFCPYTVLGITEGSAPSADEIRAAYLKMALRWHPDKNPGSKMAESERRFKEIQRAYDLLSDPRSRAIHDAAAQHSDDDEHEHAAQDWHSGHSAPARRPPQWDDPEAVRRCCAAGAFDGYGADDPRGFYRVYGAVFRRLAEPEPPGSALPDFGGPSSSPAEVHGARFAGRRRRRPTARACDALHERAALLTAPPRPPVRWQPVSTASCGRPLRRTQAGRRAPQAALPLPPPPQARALFARSRARRRRLKPISPKSKPRAARTARSTRMWRR